MPYWDYNEEPWRAWMPPGRPPQPQGEPEQPQQWDLGNLFDPIRRGWQDYGWLGRILQPLQQMAYATERGLGAIEERAPDWLARGLGQAADLTKWLPTQWPTQIGARVAGQITGAEPRPTAQENVALHLQAKEGYFDYVNELPLETKQIVNRETRRINYSGYDRRLAAAQEIVGAGDYSPEAITDVLKGHEDWKSELIGQVLYDPLNFAGVVLKPLGLTKAGRQALVGTRATEALEILPELGRIDAVRDWLLTPLSKSLDDQGAIMVYLHRAAAGSDEASELVAKLQQLKNPDELARIFADVADKDRIFLSETSRRKFLRHLDDIDLDAIEVGEKGVSQIVDEVAEMFTEATEAYHGVGPASTLEKFNRRVKSIIGIPLIGMNPAVASKNIINAAVTGVWDEGALPLAETLKALPSRGDSIRNFFIEEGLDPKHIEEWIFRGFAGAPETGAVGGLIGKIAVPGRIMRFMERFQGAATFKAGYLKTWDALYGRVVPQLAPEIIQQLGPHSDDFASLIRHSNPGNVQDKITAFMKAVESPEAVAKPLASYVDQLPQGIAQHWEEMLAPWVKEGLEIEGKSLDEVLEMLRATGARIDADVVAKVAADAPPIRAPSLEYEVTRVGEEVIKTPRPGFEVGVETASKVLDDLGDLAPKTVYDSTTNTLRQEVVKGRFATEDELVQVRQLIRERGYTARGLLPHDVIVTPAGEFKVIDVGNFEKVTEELAQFGDELFDADGWLRGRDRMWPEVAAELPGEPPIRPFPAAQIPDEARPLMTDDWSALVGRLRPPKNLLQGWIDEAAELGHTPGGAFIKRGPTTGTPKWSWLHDNGRLHVWNELVRWADEAGKVDELAELGARVIEPEDFARALIPEDLLSQASGATETPSLSRLAQVQQKAARSIFSELERIITADFQKPRGMAADVVPWIDQEVLPAMRDAQTGSLMVADLIRNDTMLNYTRRMRFDPWVDLVFPYHFWFDRSMGNWLRRIMASPAKAATYSKLRTHIMERDRDLPQRLQGMLPFAVDNILPNWAVNMIFLSPEKALIPFPSIFKEEPYERPAEKLTPLGRGMEQMQNILPMYPSPLIQYPLAVTGALGAPEQWVSGPQTPPGRLMRAASATGWGREMGERMGFEVPPTGINIEAPLLRAAGIQEVPTWEAEYWPLKHIALMAEQGEITQDEAVEAMRSQSGPLWEEAQRRTTYQKAIPTLTGAVGFPTKIRPGGEQEVTEARREQREAESYEQYREYFERHPGIGLTNLAWQMAGGEGFEEQAEEWLQWYDYRQYKEERDSAIDEYIRENPGDTKGLGELAQILGAKRPAIPDREFQRHFKMTDEEWDEAIRGNLIWRTQEFKPAYEDFEQLGYGQYDAWQAAVQEFYSQTEAGETPWMRDIIYEAARSLWVEGQITDYREANPDDREGQQRLRDSLRMATPQATDLDLSEAQELVTSLIGGQEGIEKHFRQYDSILEAAQRVYKDSYIDGAYEARDGAYAPWGAWKDAERAAGFDPDAINQLWDQYHTLPERTGQRSAFLKQYPEMLQHLEFKDEYQEEHPEAVWQNVEAQVQAVERAFGPVDAAQFIPEILERYKERGWTEEELREALGVSAMPTGEVPEGIAKWADLISGVLEEGGQAQGLLPVVEAIIALESGGKADALNQKSGAAGLMQVMPFHATAGENLKDPETNIRKGIGILVDNLNRTGDLQKALYNYSGGDAWSSFERYVERYWEPFLEKYQAFLGAEGLPAELATLTFPGFAPYREMRQRDEVTAQRETPTAPGAAVAPAAGRAVPQWAIGRRGGGTYMPASRGWGGGWEGGGGRSPWWDWEPLQEPFTWRT